jgi:hypothetical protein
VRIGIVGAGGAVGRAAARLLSTWDTGVLRLGLRDADRAGVLAARFGGRAQVLVVDVFEPVSLARFCAGCDVVLNCAGPSRDLQDRVARAALSAGADYVDAAGDDPLHTVLAGSFVDRRAVISAGMMPGLSGLLPRYLAARLARPETLTCYAGGRDRFTPAGAADYLAALDGGYGRALAAWRSGDVVSVPPDDGPVPYFARTVSALPYLSTEAERCASTLGLRELTWYSVFDGEHVPVALGQARSLPRARAVAGLVRAAELDLFGGSPYQLFVLTMTGGGERRNLVVRGGSATALTAAMAALTTEAVVRGEIPPGLHHCAEVLPVDRVDRLPATVELSDDLSPAEEVGVL